jgi:hypothetical protein
MRLHSAEELAVRYRSSHGPALAEQLGLRDAIAERLRLGVLFLSTRWHYFPDSVIQSAGQWSFSPDDDAVLLTDVDIRSDFPVLVTVRYKGVDLIQDTPCEELTGPGFSSFQPAGEDGLLLWQRDALLVRFCNTRPAAENRVRVAVKYKVFKETPA